MQLDFSTHAKRSPKLKRALDREFLNKADAEGRTDLDFLIIDVQRATERVRAEWKDAVVDVIRSQSRSTTFNWQAIERLVVLGNLQSQALGQVLEEALARKDVSYPKDRAIVYSLLDLSGMPPSAVTVSSDDQLRTSNRLLWLDLMITRVPRLEDAQQIILDAVSEGIFSVEHFRQRLSEMRSLGGKRIGDWLRTFRSKLHPNQQSEFDALVDEAFGPLALAAGSNEPKAVRDPDIRSVRTFALMDPVGASLPIGLALRRWRPSVGGKRRSAETKALLSFVRNALTYNRDAQLQYTYLTARKHKALKEALSANAAKSEVETLFLTLLEFLNRRFYEVVAKNFEFLHAYYGTKEGAPPRICLKGTFRLDANETVVSIFRDHQVDYEQQSDTAIERNSGFHHIKNTGTYFLENNLPKAAVEGTYVNPRLRIEQIREQAKFGGLGQVTTDWDRYWIGFDDAHQGDASFYKSTLIIPLTLSADVGQDFKQEVPIEDIDKSVFGFLCFDHRDVDYFDEGADVSMSEIFAGFLCHYVFTRLIYTDMSETFSNVCKILGKWNKPSRLHKLDQLARSGNVRTLQNIREQPPTQNSFDRFLLPSESATPGSKMQGIDQVLLNFTGRQMRNRAPS
jgi:hypothetical protein